MVAIRRIFLVVFDSCALGIESRHALLRKAELVRTEVVALFRFSVWNYCAALLSNNLLEDIFESRVSGTDHLNLIVVAAIYVGAIDIDVCDGLV